MLSLTRSLVVDLVAYLHAEFIGHHIEAGRAVVAGRQHLAVQPHELAFRLALRHVYSLLACAFVAAGVALRWARRPRSIILCEFGMDPKPCRTETRTLCLLRESLSHEDLGSNIWWRSD